MKGFIKKLLRENLITEKDNRVVLKTKLKLSDKLADELHALSDKYSIWFGNHLKGYEKGIIDEFGSRVTNDKLIEIIDQKLLETFNLEKEDYQKILSLLKIDNKPKTDINRMDFSGMLSLYNTYTQSIKDWLNSPEVRNSNIRNLTWKEAISKADEWHDSLGSGGALEGNIIGGKDDIIHEFGDGFMWVLHKDYKCDASEKSMGHCGTATEIDMYLLRLIKGNEEFVTGDWDPTDKYIIQLKGKGNNKPHEKYHKYILWLLVEWGNVDELRTNTGYRAETNFQLSDLNEDEYTYIFSKAPNILNEDDVKNYFYKIYDSNKGNDKFVMLKIAIQKLITNNEFMSKVNTTWVREIIRYGKDEEINLANTFIDKLINNKFFENIRVDYYDFEYVMKYYNNPVKLLEAHNPDTIYRYLIIDGSMGILLNKLADEGNNVDSVINYFTNQEKYLKESDYYDKYLEHVTDKDALINKILNYYTTNKRVINYSMDLITLLQYASNPLLIYKTMGKEDFDAVLSGLNPEAYANTADKARNPKMVLKLLKSITREESLAESIKKKLKL